MISIAIPTYEMNGVGAKMLIVLLNTIRMQKCLYPFEVVISDNSKNDEIKNICNTFKILPIKYYRNEITGASENINNAISLGSYDLVKPMMQDDAFLIPSALNFFVEALDKNKWVISNSVRIDGRGNIMSHQQTQYKHGNLGKNITGMPSVIAFHKNELRFRTDLKTVCDMYFYHQLYELYGEPGVIKEFTIAQRFHGASLSHHQTSKHREEVKLLKQSGLV